MDEAGRLLVEFLHIHAQNGPGKVFGRRQAQQAVDVGQVVPKQQVEFGAILRRVLRPVPPAPVAALGDQEFLVSQAPVLLWNCRPTGRGGRALVCLRAANSASQARLSSSAPIQISKFELIHDPGKMWAERLRRTRLSASLTVSASICGSPEMRRYSAERNGLPFSS